MKAYLITTGILFVGMIGLHILKAYYEGIHTLKDPHFILLTLLSAGLAVWAFCLLKSVSRRPHE